MKDFPLSVTLSLPSTPQEWALNYAGSNGAKVAADSLSASLGQAVTAIVAGGQVDATYAAVMAPALKGWIAYATDDTKMRVKRWLLQAATVAGSLRLPSA